MTKFGSMGIKAVLFGDDFREDDDLVDRVPVCGSVGLYLPWCFQ